MVTRFAPFQSMVSIRLPFVTPVNIDENAIRVPDDAQVGLI